MIWLIGTGHGGLINEVYQTSGKQYHFPDVGKKKGMSIYEGEFNRKVAKELFSLLDEAGIEYIDIVNSQEDISLKERVNRANEIWRDREDCIYLSIHGNAGKGTGHETFVYNKDSSAGDYGSIFNEELTKGLPEFRARGLKEANFYVLKKTFMPAILTENLFMDTYKDCEFMLSSEGQKRIAKAHFEAIKRITS